jgi:hypothetical protein
MTIEEQLLELQDRVSNMQKAMFDELAEIWQEAALAILNNNSTTN